VGNRIPDSGDEQSHISVSHRETIFPSSPTFFLAQVGPVRDKRGASVCGKLDPVAFVGRKNGTPPATRAQCSASSQERWDPTQTVARTGGEEFLHDFVREQSDGIQSGWARKRPSDCKEGKRRDREGGHPECSNEYDECITSTIWKKDKSSFESEQQFLN